MPMESARLLVVEGVPGAGKSTILDHLVRRHVSAAPPRRLRTLVHLTQAHTYGPLAPDEDAGTLTREACLDHLARVVTGLEWLVRSMRGETHTKCFILVDCLHLAACLRPGVVGWSDVAPLDKRLAAIGCRLLLIDANDDTVRERSVRERMSSEFIRGYAARRFGSTENELVRHFQRERDTFRALFDASQLVKSRLPAEAPEEANASAAFRFWQSDGIELHPGAEV